MAQIIESNNYGHVRTPMRFWRSETSLMRNRSYCKEDCRYFLIMPTHYIFDFQIIRPTRFAPITLAVIEKLDGSDQQNIVPPIITQIGTKDYLSYRSWFNVLNDELECGSIYQVRISDDVDTWISEPIKVLKAELDSNGNPTRDIPCHLKLVWWSNCDLFNMYNDIFRNPSDITIGFGLYNELFLPEEAEVGFPDYKPVEEGSENGLKVFNANLKNRTRRFGIEFGLIPEHILDAIMDIRFFPWQDRSKGGVELHLKNKLGTEWIGNIEVDYNWEFHKCYSSAIIRFSFNDDQAETNCCESLPVLICCAYLACVTVSGFISDYEEEDLIIGNYYIADDNTIAQWTEDGWVLYTCDSGIVMFAAFEWAIIHNQDFSTNPLLSGWDWLPSTGGTFNWNSIDERLDFITIASGGNNAFFIAIPTVLGRRYRITYTISTAGTIDCGVGAGFGLGGEFTTPLHNIVNDTQTFVEVLSGGDGGTFAFYVIGDDAWFDDVIIEEFTAPAAVCYYLATATIGVTDFSEWIPMVGIVFQVVTRETLKAIIPDGYTAKIQLSPDDSTWADANGGTYYTPEQLISGVPLAGITSDAYYIRICTKNNNCDLGCSDSYFVDAL